MVIGKHGISFSAAHRLHGHSGKCGSLHGHNYRVLVEVTGTLSEAGMVMDFSALKALLKGVVDELDHVTILAADDPLVPLIQRDPDTRLVTLPLSPTVEVLVQWISAKLSDRLRGVSGVALRRVVLHETDDSYAEMDNRDAQCSVNAGTPSA